MGRDLLVNRPPAFRSASRVERRQLVGRIAANSEIQRAA
jgi:hypothetical protein